ncbi:MAG: hypothetical protein HY076_04760 [Candidatus Eisenbacteria bacterium]|uniref:DinB family protein n=1 Tax=Eiseniibacteriota bacterium TaxID=2212470 RepID=A0A9D6L4B2_UNCEI|nr:hypothetical protein [Candidatus Eisenbacteria bacterium]MBI3539562.1 hypothetical protein [Candidatus Eisenbacteria bacterium]
MRGIDGAHGEALVADLESALRDLAAPIERDPALWSRGLPRRWTAGQHTEHIAASMDLSAAPFEAAVAKLRDGTLPPVPGRGPLQSLWVVTILRMMPTGGRAHPATRPGTTPEREVVAARIARTLERHRAVVAALAAGERDRLWIANPYIPRFRFALRWHYNLPEMLRVHAVHARHHAHLIEAIAGRV